MTNTTSVPRLSPSPLLLSPKVVLKARAEFPPFQSALSITLIRKPHVRTRLNKYLGSRASHRQRTACTLKLLPILRIAKLKVYSGISPPPGAPIDVAHVANGIAALYEGATSPVAQADLYFVCANGPLAFPPSLSHVLYSS